MNKSLSFQWIGIALLLIGLSSCADPQQVERCVTGHTYGFWGGLWHGTIAPIAFIGSLFSDDIAVWASNNNGNRYTFGFLLGVGAFTGGSSKASRPYRRRFWKKND
jgi:hypothetical protein